MLANFFSHRAIHRAHFAARLCAPIRPRLHARKNQAAKRTINSLKLARSCLSWRLVVGTRAGSGHRVATCARRKEDLRASRRAAPPRRRGQGRSTTVARPRLPPIATINPLPSKQPSKQTRCCTVKRKGEKEPGGGRGRGDARHARRGGDALLAVFFQVQGKVLGVGRGGGKLVGWKKRLTACGWIGWVGGMSERMVMLMFGANLRVGGS